MRRSTKSETAVTSRTPRNRPAASSSCRSLALAVALALTAGAVDRASVASAAGSQFPGVARARPESPAVVTTWTVQNCDDSGTDSLRDIIENPANAKSGDIVDLSELPTRCNLRESVVTLGSEILVAQDDLTLHGPSSAQGTVTLSGAHTSRVFHHTGAGTFYASKMVLRDGYAHAAGDVAGGCILSDSGAVYLKNIVVDHCTAASDNGKAYGGGVRGGDITLVYSTISANTALAHQGPKGGGVFAAAGFTSKYSTINANSAYNIGVGGLGGGVFASGGAVFIRASTIASNKASQAGGLSLILGASSATIVDSTISKNLALLEAGAAIDSAAAHIYNSTVAFNQATNNVEAGALNVFGDVVLRSSIVANNTVGSAGEPGDLYVDSNATISGTDNLIIQSNLAAPPAGLITVTSDPKLGPLQMNGGPTATHELLSGSLAIGTGDTLGLLPPLDTSDQRGALYPRTTGPNAAVDIGAVQYDTIFADNFDTFF